MVRLRGVFCALWTPTDAEGEVLWNELERHVDFLVAAGIHGFMALGSTAEFPHLSLNQRKQILKRLVRRRAMHETRRPKPSIRQVMRESPPE